MFEDMFNIRPSSCSRSLFIVKLVISTKECNTSETSYKLDENLLISVDDGE